MPYRVVRTIKLGRGLARSPGDIFSQADIDEIPAKIRPGRVQGLLDRGKIIWEEDTEGDVKKTREIVREVLAEEAAANNEKPVVTKTVEGIQGAEEKKKPGRPKKEK